MLDRRLELLLEPEKTAIQKPVAKQITSKGDETGPIL